MSKICFLLLIAIPLFEIGKMCGLHKNVPQGNTKKTRLQSGSCSEEDVFFYNYKRQYFDIGK